MRQEAPLTRQAAAVANVVRDATIDLATKANPDALEGRLNERLAAQEARLLTAMADQKAEIMDALRQQAMTFLKTTLAAVGATAGVVGSVAAIVIKLLG